MTINTEKKQFLRFFPDFFAFGICLGLARYLRWDTTDLVWSLWLSSLTLGYLTFFSAFAGGVYYVFRQKEFPENRRASDILIAIAVGALFLAFFSFHFGAFHAGHASFLYSFFPIEGVPEKEFGKAFFNPLLLWVLAFNHLVMPYGFFLVTVIIAERKHVFRHLLNGFYAVHAESTGTANPAGAEKKESESDSNPLADIVLRPYINVIRMHMLIFFFAFSHAVEIDGFLVFAIVCAVYFFPWHEITKDEQKLLNSVMASAMMAAVTIFVWWSIDPGPEPTRLHVTQRSDVREIARDGRFVAYSDDTVLDTRTNLMWAAQDNGSNIGWYAARQYCANYRGGGYKDWRMPTRAELSGLYDPDSGYLFGRQSTWTVHLTDLIQLSSPSVWTSERRDADAYRINFIYGSIDWIKTTGEGLRLRVLPVRDDT